MHTENLTHSVDAYNALISGCASSRGYDRAIGYFNDMVRCLIPFAVICGLTTRV